MLNPMDSSTGRAVLLFAVIIFVFGLFVGVVRQVWRDAALLLSIAMFMGCYGAITLNAVPRLHRLLLMLGLGAGVMAFLIAVLMMLEQ